LTRARTFIGREIKSLDKKSLYGTTDISYITYIVSNGLARAKTAFGGGGCRAHSPLYREPRKLELFAKVGDGMKG
jgi:hypothetical protein